MHRVGFIGIRYGSHTAGRARRSRVWLNSPGQCPGCGGHSSGHAQRHSSPCRSTPSSPAFARGVGAARRLRGHPTAPARAKPGAGSLGCSGRAQSIPSPGSVIASYSTRCPQDLARSLVQSRRAWSWLGPCTAFLRGANFIGKEESCSL